MIINTSNTVPKGDQVSQINKFISEEKFHIFEEDFDRPWGGFVRLHEEDVVKFVSKYFPNNLDLLDSDLPMSPKFLLIAPKMRLSWQYHYRRSEIWRVIAGSIAIVKSFTDIENEPEIMEEGQIIEFPLSIRHRGIGLDSWGLVAEIWKHEDVKHPSDESDIVRISDDFNRHL